MKWLGYTLSMVGGVWLGLTLELRELIPLVIMLVGIFMSL